MWENEQKKTIIRNILILILLAVTGIGLMVSFRKVKNQIAAEDARLSAANRDQRQELIDAREGRQEEIQQVYEEDLAAVQRFLPGIVCWGDSLTAGASNDVSYPSTLQKYLDAYVCGIYDLRYSLANPEEYTRVNWSDYKISIPVVNMGIGRENTDTILGYVGVSPFVVKPAFVIPAEKDAVKITFTSPSGKAVTPLTDGSAGMNPVNIGGVEGTLSLVISDNNRSKKDYQFTRNEAGEEVSIEAGTEIIPAVADRYCNYIHIVWIGTYDGTQTPRNRVNAVKQLLARQTENTDRYLVIGPCTYNGTWKLYDSAALDAIDSAMQQTFGDRYVNLRKYLIEEGLRDAGISPSGEDTASMAKGLVPNSFRSNAAGADLNSIGYELVGKYIYGRMDRLGYFEELRDELNLDEAMQDILKYNPSYFENVLAVN